MTHLTLIIDPVAMPMFLPLLQKGVGMEVQTGGTIRQVLCDQVGLSADYLDGRIQTLFLDARPVDDVDSAHLQDGATLALSAAMPGLLGATMRKGGHYAAFRQAISQTASTHGHPESASGRVTVKMFNMVAEEVGPGLLEKGVWVDSRQVQRIGELNPTGWQTIRDARIDGEPTDPQTLLSQLGQMDPAIHLTVHIHRPST